MAERWDPEQKVWVPRGDYEGYMPVRGAEAASTAAGIPWIRVLAGIVLAPLVLVILVVGVCLVPAFFAFAFLDAKDHPMPVWTVGPPTP